MEKPYDYSINLVGSTYKEVIKNGKRIKRCNHQIFSNGIIDGSELLFTPEVAIQFLDEADKQSTNIIGCDLWQYLNSNKYPGRAMELLGAGFL